jgi:hypothetical protein
MQAALVSVCRIKEFRVYRAGGKTREPSADIRNRIYRNSNGDEQLAA